MATQVTIQATQYPACSGYRTNTGVKEKYWAKHFHISNGGKLYGGESLWSKIVMEKCVVES